MSEESLLHSFVVFNAVPPAEEGADPKVFWHYANHEITDPYYQMNQAGLIITFVSFCKRFATDKPCDYVFTNVHEISILELSGPIWMGVVLNSRKATNRSLLHSILIYCRNMFSYFFHPLGPISGKPPRDPTADPAIVRCIEYAFPSIVESIDWNRLDFTYIFNSCVMQKLDTGMDDLELICRNLIANNRDLIDNIAILYQKRKVIASTFDTEVTRILAFAMRHRFKHLFLHSPRAVRPERLTWLIGRYINKLGMMSTYQQPLYIDGKPHLILAFRYKRFKIVLTQPPDVEVSELGYERIEKMLTPLTDFLRERTAVVLKPSVPLHFALTMNNSKDQRMTFECVQIDALSRYRVDWNFIGIHEATCDYAPKAVVGLTAKHNWFVKCDRTTDDQEMILTFSKDNTQGMAHGVTRSLRFCKMIVNSMDKKHTVNPFKCEIQ